MDALAKSLQAHFGFRVRGLSAISGGDIARAYLLETDRGRFFAKWYDSPAGREMVRAEAGGLEALAASRSLRTPDVAGWADLDPGACLLLEYLSPRQAEAGDFERLGRGLAALHGNVMPLFGWQTDNFIGRLPQQNAPGSAWPDFYVSQRLLPQYRMARAGGLLSKKEVPGEELLTEKVRAWAPNPEPSLLHGDLWSGNYLIAESGDACLIDPAVYAGDAEVDLAMTRLFGGFPERFYRAYHEIRPEKPGMDWRIPLYQLYYLLVHLNLFGAGYASSVHRIHRELFGL